MVESSYLDSVRFWVCLHSEVRNNSTSSQAKTFSVVKLWIKSQTYQRIPVINWKTLTKFLSILFGNLHLWKQILKRIFSEIIQNYKNLQFGTIKSVYILTKLWEPTVPLWVMILRNSPRRALALQFSLFVLDSLIFWYSEGSKAMKFLVKPICNSFFECCNNIILVFYRSLKLKNYLTACCNPLLV